VKLKTGELRRKRGDPHAGTIEQQYASISRTLRYEAVDDSQTRGRRFAERRARKEE